MKTFQLKASWEIKDMETLKKEFGITDETPFGIMTRELPFHVKFADFCYDDYLDIIYDDERITLYSGDIMLRKWSMELPHMIESYFGEAIQLSDEDQKILIDGVKKYECS